MYCTKLISGRLRAGAWGLLALFLALGCARREESAASAPVLSLAPSYGAVSRVGFAAGDAIGVWAALDGREADALSNHPFSAASDGITFTASPAAHYPNERDAVRLYAYFPYQAAWDGTFAVEADQSTPERLKLSDLCWGTTQTTPSEAPVPLSFKHLLAKIAVSVSGLPSGTTVSRISWPAAASNGALDVKTGVFAIGTAPQTLSTTSTELIAPAQALARLEIELSDGTTYTYAPSSAPMLQAGYVHTINLTLHAANHTADLAAPIQTTEWTTAAGSGSAQHAVANTFLVHWLLPHPDFAQAVRAVVYATDGVSGRKAALTSTSYTPDGSSTAQAGQCRFSVEALEELAYPYRIDSVAFLRADGSTIQLCPTLLAQGVFRAGTVSLGIFQDNILLVTTDPIVRWDEETIPGGFDDYRYQGNVFMLHAVEPQFDWKRVATVRFKIWNGIAEWRGLALNQTATGASMLVETPDLFTFPDANGFIPGPRHYPIEWVELADASGAYLYRGYTHFEVSESGRIDLWLYPNGRIETPGSAIVRPIGQAVIGSLDNAKFSNNTLMLRFFNCYFDTKAARTVRLLIGSTEYVWDFAAAPGANDLLFWGAVTFPDKYGSKPNNAMYRVETVELRDGAGNYLYKNYCAFDIQYAGTATIDMHQRGSVDAPSTVTPPSSSTGDDLNPPSGTTYVANTFNLRFYDPPFDRLAANKIALTLSDGKTYTWNVGVGWSGTSTNPSYGSATATFPAPTGGRPAAYPFTVTGVEVFNGTASLYKKTGLSTTVSYQGSAIVVIK